MTLAKILARSVRRNGCFLFALGGHKHNRYGCVSLPGEGGKYHKMGAHRAVWILTNGPIPEGMEVCHKCDQTRCVNIDHLFLATHAQNMQDRDAKGRNGTLGENSALSKLTAEQVLEIRGCVGLGISPSVIAEQFNISQVTVKRIKDGTTWKHLIAA